MDFVEVDLSLKIHIPCLAAVMYVTDSQTTATIAFRWTTGRNCNN